MADILNDEQLSRRAANAKRLMEDPLYKESFAFVREKLVNIWQETPTAAKDEREMLFFMLKGMNELEEFFAIVLQDGEAAEFQLKTIEGGKA